MLDGCTKLCWSNRQIAGFDLGWFGFGKWMPIWGIILFFFQDNRVCFCDNCKCSIFLQFIWDQQFLLGKKYPGTQYLVAMIITYMYNCSAYFFWILKTNMKMDHLLCCLLSKKKRFYFISTSNKSVKNCILITSKYSISLEVFYSLN